MTNFPSYFFEVGTRPFSERVDVSGWYLGAASAYYTNFFIPPVLVKEAFFWSLSDIVVVPIDDEFFFLS